MLTSRFFYTRFFSVVVVALASFFFARLTLAANVSFESLAGSTVGLEQPSEIIVRFDSAGEWISAIEGNIALPTGVRLKEIHDGSSLVTLWVERPEENDGAIRFAGIIPGGWSGERGELFTLVVEAAREGAISWGQGTVTTLLFDERGTNVPTSLTALSLTALAGVGLPVTELVPPDTVLPEDVTIEVSQSPDVFNDQKFVAFTAADKQTGIAYYEIREEPAWWLKRLFASRAWRRVESPALLEDQNQRSTIFIRAVDRAGNERITSIPPASPATWYESPLLGILVGGIVALGFLLWRLMRHR